MLRQDKAFTGVLTKCASKAKDENVFLELKIRHIEEGDMPSFLDSYENKCELENIKNLFKYPIQWKSLDLEAKYKFKIEFDEVEFEGVLTGIKVRRTYHKAMESYIYDLTINKECDKDSDLFISQYLNQKEEDENGKKGFIQYSVYLTPLERVVENIPAESLESEASSAIPEHSSIDRTDKMKEA